VRKRLGTPDLVNDEEVEYNIKGRKFKYTRRKTQPIFNISD
jgi:hypothetical protein